MGNKCIVFGGTSSYKSKNKVSAFEFRSNESDLSAKWIKFVDRQDWQSTKNSVICIKNFEEKFITRGKRNTL